MPYRPKTEQLDLFAAIQEAEAARTPPWPALPEETRSTLTTLMVRLILDHIAVGESTRGEDVHHDG